ncbi:MAG: class beta-lactamase-related serine hydrolase [Streptosporangiaceae bacterium]|jgi:CubicO group peptidase (beta-lactamase class C family)|nr:class beta-lactamase-related serine hydrolase [Streptosporangiaceae bacterium]
MTDISGLLNDLVPPLLDQFQVPGIAVGTSLEGTRTLSGFGITSVENPLPIDADTIFQVGSISKTMLAAVVAELVKRGALSLDATAVSLLPEPGALDPRITIEQLLNHASGIDAQHMIGAAPRLLASGADDSLLAALPHFDTEPLRFPPGTDFSYSGPGIMVAAAAVEAVTGAYYPDLLRHELLAPAGMKRTFTTADEVMTYRVAAPHDLAADGSARVLHDEGWQRHWQLPSWDVPGGGVLSNVRDLMAYGEYLLASDVADVVLKAYRGRGIENQEIGLSWFLDRVDGDLVWSHSGVTVGYVSQMTVVPSAQLTLAILTNSQAGGLAARKIERELVRLVTQIDLRPDLDQRVEVDLNDFVGVYDNGFYGTIELTRGDGDGELIMESKPTVVGEGEFALGSPSRSVLAAYSADALIVLRPAEDAGLLVGYVRGPDGRVAALRPGSRLALRSAVPKSK